MFFNLSRSQDSRFPNHFQLGELTLSTDNGWQTNTTNQHMYIYKGYMESSKWDITVLESLQDHDELGNFVCFRLDQQSGLITMLTNRWRGVMIWFEPGAWISNLVPGTHVIWNDSVVSVGQDLIPVEQKIDIIGEIDPTYLDVEQVVTRIDTVLANRVANFVKHNHLPIKVFCSGGIDSTLVWSYIKRFSNDYELVLENRVQWDEFWCLNRKKITKNFWGYTQIHHWRDPCILTSGTPGDEFMMRGPTTVNLWCMYHGIDIFDLLRTRDFLHYDYFMQDKHQKLFIQQQQDRALDPVMRLDRTDFIKYICNINANDCQHWHLGNTLTFTPLRDMQVLKLMLALDVDDLLSQALDSAISKRLIAQNDANLLSVLSDTKNIGETLSNLAQCISK